MSIEIKVKRGLHIPIKGYALPALENAPRAKYYAVKPSDFIGVNPRLFVQPGDRVKAGDALFYSKYRPEVVFASPVSGTVKEIVRGKRRVILRIIIEADARDEYRRFDASDRSRDDILKALLSSGLFPYIKQRPYDIVPNPDDTPKAIYISTFDTSPLAPDYAFALQKYKDEFQKGIDVLTKLTDGDVYLIVDGEQTNFFYDIRNVKLVKVTGPHPAGNVSVAIAHTHPISKGDRIWTLRPWDTVFIGRLFNEGILNMQKNIAFTGDMLKKPQYYSLIPGAYIKDFLTDLLQETKNIRIISGNPLTGTNISNDGFIHTVDDSITVLREGNRPRFMGWLPFLGTSRKTVYRLNFDWFSDKERSYDTSLHGEERPFVMTDEAEEVMPLDIYPVHLLKACLTGDVDKMERLGILEVAPEDFALIDYISSSKIDAQKIIRDGLNIMMIEVG